MRVLGGPQCRGGGAYWSATGIPTSVFGDVQISEGNAVAGFFYVIGILIMVLAGGCSFMVLADPYIGGSGALLMVAVMGGVPFLVGLGIAALAGRSMRRVKDLDTPGDDG